MTIAILQFTEAAKTHPAVISAFMAKVPEVIPGFGLVLLQSPMVSRQDGTPVKAVINIEGNDDDANMSTLMFAFSQVIVKLNDNPATRSKRVATRRSHRNSNVITLDIE